MAKRKHSSPAAKSKPASKSKSKSHASSARSKPKTSSLLSDIVFRATGGEVEAPAGEEDGAQQIMEILMQIDRNVEEVVQLAGAPVASKLVMATVARAFGGPENLEELVGQGPSLAMTEPLREVYRLKITLQDAPCDIHRVIDIPDCALDYLHAAIQLAMGWENCHLHVFQAGKEVFGPCFLDGGPPTEWADEAENLLSDLINSGAIKKLHYEYDMGDGWRHRIELVSRTPVDKRPSTPKCIEGAGACPPEDCGGVWGYAELLERQRDGELEEEDMIGKDFDAKFFDLKKANSHLKHLAWSEFH